MIHKGLTSIVILAHNQLSYTRQCIESIKRSTSSQYELILVDNGSTDGTLDYFRSLPSATVLDYDINLGFSGGCNMGIAASCGDRILLLNNDVVVTEGWLDRLHRALDMPNAGLVGPRTNRIAGSQRVPEVDYNEDTLEKLEEWAAKWADVHPAQTSQTFRLIGFCMLMERAVIERIGGLDLSYGLGNFEDDDFCLRSAVAGFECLVAEDVFIHHFGSRTFAGEGINHDDAMSKGYKRFRESWRLDGAFSSGSYDPQLAIEGNPFDKSRHWKPIVGQDIASRTLEFETDSANVIAAFCDRLDQRTTKLILQSAVAELVRDQGSTLLVRIDPRDSCSLDVLDQVTSHLGDELVDKIVVVESSDIDDRIILRRANQVIDTGRTSWARQQNASHFGVEVHSVTNG